MSKKIMIVAVLIAIAVGGYWSTQKTNGGSQPETNSSLLSRVPADTVWFLGGLEKTPFFNPYNGTTLDALMGSTNEQFKQLEQLTKNKQNPATSMLIGLYFKALDQFYNQKTTEMIDMALYSLGVYPVAAWQSSDVPAFTKMLDSIEQEKNISSRKFALKNAELREYVFSADAPVKLYIATNGDIISIGATSDNESVLKLFAGVEFPSKNISSTNKLESISSEHNLKPFSLFYLDMNQAFKSLSSSDDNLLKQTLQEVSEGKALAEIEGDLCFDDYATIMTRWPRLIFGYREFDVSKNPLSMEAAFIIENTDSSFLQSLKDVSGTLPDFSFDEDIFSMGVGLNVNNLASFVTGLQQDFINQDFKCKNLVDMQTQAKQSNVGMMAMGTQMVSGLKGASVHVTKLDVAAITSGNMDSVEGMVVITSSNPKNLLLTASNFYPPLAQLTLEENAESQPLTLPMGIVANIAMSENALTLQIGDSEGLNSRVAGVHQGEGLTSSLFKFGMDFSAYFKMLEPMMAGALSQAGSKNPEQMKQIMTAMEQLDMKFSYQFNVESKGLVFSMKILMNNEVNKDSL